MSYASAKRANEKRVAIGRALLAAGFKLHLSPEVCDPITDYFRDEYWDGEATAPNKDLVKVGYIHGLAGQWVKIRRRVDTVDSAREWSLWPTVGEFKVTTVKNTVARIVAACTCV